MLRKSIVLSILKEDNTIYEKHLFDSGSLSLWQHACMFMGVSIIKAEVVLVWEDL